MEDEPDDRFAPPAPELAHSERPLLKDLALPAAVATVFLLAALIFAFTLGRSCAPPGPPRIEPLGIDAGPGLEAIAERERLAEEQAERELHALELAHRHDLERFDHEQRAKYEHVREEGPDAVARWLTDFNRSLRDASP